MRDDSTLLLLLLAGALAVVFGGVIMLSFVGLDATQRRWAAALAAAFKVRGLNERWAVALGLTESVLRPRANLAGADGARGGAWGPTQITETTARAYGYQGPMADLNTDPELAADLTARMVADGFAQRYVDGVSQTFYYGPPSSPEAMAAVWNAGRTLDDPELSLVTRTVYTPKLVAYLGSVA